MSRRSIGQHPTHADEQASRRCEHAQQFFAAICCAASLGGLPPPGPPKIASAARALEALFLPALKQ
eukprot:9449986-Alexandrium_andersonii.AAC.1